MSSNASDREPLLAATGIRLFGLIVAGLSIDLDKAGTDLGTSLKKLKRDDKPAQLARIHGFSYEGQYFPLARPAIFLVHGDGEDGGSEAARTGVAAEAGVIPTGLRVWPYDQADFTIRLDMDAGPFDRVLLENELGPDLQRLGYAGQSARLDYNGQSARLGYGGQSARLRYAGQSVRLRGGGGSGD